MAIAITKVQFVKPSWLQHPAKNIFNIDSVELLKFGIANGKVLTIVNASIVSNIMNVLSFSGVSCLGIKNAKSILTVLADSIVAYSHLNSYSLDVQDSLNTWLASRSHKR